MYQQTSRYRYVVTNRQKVNPLIERATETDAADGGAEDERKAAERAAEAGAADAAPNRMPLPEIGKQLHSVLYSAGVHPRAKSDAIHDYTRRMLEGLYLTPSAESIAEVKKTIGHVVDVVLSDDETTQCLLSLSRHDHCTYAHSVNVGVYAVALAKRLYGRSRQRDLSELGAAFFLHDLGKTRIDLTILNKPGRLDEAELREMRTHPKHTDDILCETGHATPECRIIALQHHEREDGTGYPFGLKGDQIHPYARICSLADVFDALTAERPYKKALSTFEALNIMREQMIGHFHPELLQDFITLFAQRDAAANALRDGNRAPRPWQPSDSRLARRHDATEERSEQNRAA